MNIQYMINIPGNSKFKPYEQIWSFFKCLMQYHLTLRQVSLLHLRNNLNHKSIFMMMRYFIISSIYNILMLRITDCFNDFGKTADLHGRVGHSEDVLITYLVNGELTKSFWLKGINIEYINLYQVYIWVTLYQLKWFLLLDLINSDLEFLYFSVSK